jgi:hypothetical protein
MIFCAGPEPSCVSPSSHAGFASVCRDRIELPLSTVELNLVDCRVELHCDLH